MDNLHNEKFIKSHNSYSNLTYNVILELNFELEPSEQRIVKNRLITMINKFSKQQKITLEDLTLNKNKLNIIFKALPNIKISNFINVLKTTSSKLLKKEYDFVEKKVTSSLWKNKYYVFSLNNIEQKIMKKQINELMKNE